MLHPRLLACFCGVLCIFLLGAGCGGALAQAAEEDEEAAFTIVAFRIEGNTIFDDYTLLKELLPFIGPDKKGTEVEAAAGALEKFHQQQGYPAVLVNIPPQTVDDGVIRLEVVESRIRKVRITGNKYVTMEKVLDQAPSLREGEIPYLPDIKRDLASLNTSSYLAVEPVLAPGREPATIDVELRVKDRLPLTASLELNNRYSANSTELRLNGSISYDNFWQKDHSGSFQFQVSPQDFDEVQLLAGSYVLPTPWNRNHRIAAYAVWSDSQTAFAEGLQVVGKGHILGIRYIMPLPALERYSHNISLGVDYKSFRDVTGTGGQDDIVEQVRYLPLNASYNSTLSDRWGRTAFSAGLNFAFRNLASDTDHFGAQRAGARGDYLYLTAGIERQQELPWLLSVFCKLDGQLASQPLISNEQYTAGGMDSVRGYLESEQSGDNALHGTVDLSGPELVGLMGKRFPDLDLFRDWSLTPYLFFDGAALWRKQPLPDEKRSVRIEGTGLGLRGNAGPVRYEADWAMAIEDSIWTERGDDRFYFLLAYRHR
ncbi:MAG: POTRA domain-containing protein [Thermodesulfobacteriota bacterium]